MAKPPSGVGVRLISFDIDGTLEIGEPPGAIPMIAVQRAYELGFVVGSCSDRTLSVQKQIWQDHDVDVHFTVLKQNLALVREQFEAEHYLHIGDSPVDEIVAREAGFSFLHVLKDDIAGFLREHRLHPI